MGYMHLDDGDRAKIWQLHAAGHNTNEISKLSGRVYATVGTLLKAAGGIRPVTPATPSSSLRLTMAEREEISRGLTGREAFTLDRPADRSCSTAGVARGRPQRRRTSPKKLRSEFSRLR